jgi:hypothetical protein
LREAHAAEQLNIAPRELPWLDRIQKMVEALPDCENEFIDEMLGVVDKTVFTAVDYEL